LALFHLEFLQDLLDQLHQHYLEHQLDQLLLGFLEHQLVQLHQLNRHHRRHRY
jgi:hypothetical protein